MTTTNCRSCEAPIIWTTTERGKAMPLDADPSDSGTFAIVEDQDIRSGWPQLLSVWKTKAPKGSELYTSHFATCPHAALHRR